MNTPTAVRKAEALARHAAYLGVKLEEFRVTLTLGEGYELLDYLAAGGLGRFSHHELLVSDIEQAKLEGDPWLVLSDWRIQGLEIVRLETLN